MRRRTSCRIRQVTGSRLEGRLSGARESYSTGPDSTESRSMRSWQMPASRGGAFYRYYDSKSDLYAEVMNCFFTDPEWSSSWDGVHVDLTAKDVGSQIVCAYLSRQHFENIDDSCPMVALPTDIARSGPSAKRAFENVFNGMVDALEGGLIPRSMNPRSTAQAIAALCVGGMVIARAMEDRAAADELCDAALSVALK